MPCDSFNTPVAAPQGAVLQSLQRRSLSAELMWHLVQWHSDIFLAGISFQQHLRRNAECSFVSFSSFSFCEQGETQHRTKMIHVTCWRKSCHSYAEGEKKRKGTKRLMSTIKKAAALDLRDNWIKGATVKAMCNQTCPYQQAFSLLCPHSPLSAASRLIKLPCLYLCKWWLTGLGKALIFKCAGLFSLWGSVF